MVNKKIILNFLVKNLLKIEKRIRFIISALILSSLMLLSTFFFFDKAWLFIPIFIVATYFLTFFSIVEGINKIEWIALFLMPVLFTVSFYIFYFLFPVRWLTRLPFIFIYFVSIYAIFLTSNIFNVGVEKSLQLYRAAFSINYFYQTLVIFLFFNTLFSLKINFLINGLVAFLISFVLATHLFWSISLKLKLEKKNLHFGFLIGLALTEVAVILSFVPFKTSILALVLTASYYSLAGLTYSYLDQRLFKETIKEYLFVLGFVFLISLLSLSW